MNYKLPEGQSPFSFQPHNSQSFCHGAPSFPQEEPAQGYVPYDSKEYVERPTKHFEDIHGSHKKKQGGPFGKHKFSQHGTESGAGLQYDAEGKTNFYGKHGRQQYQVINRGSNER